MTWAMTSAQVAVMPQVYHLFRACGVRGGCPAGRTMMSCGVRGSPSGGRESNTAPVSAIRFFACFSPLPSRLSPFLSRFAALRAVSARSASGRIDDALGVRGHPQHGEPFLPAGPAMTGASGTGLSGRELLRVRRAPAPRSPPAAVSRC